MNKNTSNKTPSASVSELKPTSNEILNKALNKSFNVGMAGYGAMAFQVGSLMWLRTTMNYQFKNGGGTWDTLKLL